jgi:hypothetical protein
MLLYKLSNIMGENEWNALLNGDFNAGNNQDNLLNSNIIICYINNHKKDTTGGYSLNNIYIKSLLNQSENLIIKTNNILYNSQS